MVERRVWFPIMADITSSKCVVVGGGAIGWRKAASLLECGANVVVVSPEGVPALEAAAAEGKLRWERRTFRPEDLEGAVLAFAATNDAVVNELVRTEAKRLGVWLNAAYDAGQGDFIVPSALRRGKLLMTVTTGGASPKLARRIVGEWETTYGPEYAGYLEILGRLRHYILTSDATAEQKLHWLSELLSLDIVSRLRNGELQTDIAAQLEAWLNIQLYS
jgi:precorrin-2 dehydrogenase/sirohydrochlorin ferrochelatase